MNSPEIDQTPGFLDRIRDFASNTVDRLTSISNKEIAAYGAAAVTSFFGSAEIAQNNQAEARTPIDSGNPAMVGTVTVKNTVTKKDGDTSTTVEISRQKYDPFPDDDYVPTGLFTAMNGSKNPSTTTYKGGKFNPLDVKFTMPDAYGCNVETSGKVPFKYNANKKYKIPGRPTHKKTFGKKPLIVNGQLMTTFSTGDIAKDQAIIDQASNGPSSLSKIKKLKQLKVRPNKTGTRDLAINMDQCYPLAEATYADYDKHKAAGYKYVPPTLRLEYVAKIKNKKRGVSYSSEVRGNFEMVDINIFDAHEYSLVK